MPPVISLSLLTNCPGVLCKSHLIRPQIGWIYAHPDAKMSFTKHLSHEDGGHWWNYTDSGCRTAPALGSGCLPRVGMLRGVPPEHFFQTAKRPDLLKACVECAGWCTNQAQWQLDEKNVQNNTRCPLSTSGGAPLSICNIGCLCRAPNKSINTNMWILRTHCDLQSPELIAVAVVRLSLARLKGRC